MALAKWLILIGGILLLIGLLMALKSSHTFALVMGAARMGVAVLASGPNSPETQQRERLVKRSDVAFAWGACESKRKNIQCPYGDAHGSQHIQDKHHRGERDDHHRD